MRRADQAGAMHIITLESCHSTWIFDPRQLRFCRILRGIAAGRPRISTEWRPYWELKIDRREEFHRLPERSTDRLVRSSLHTDACAACGASNTTELPLEEISRAVA